jgi:DNA-binding transcriptional LysR family regulator
VSDVARSALAREPLALALSPAGAVDHGSARAALNRAGRRHSVTYASANLAGVSAMVRAGLAITVLEGSAVPPDLLALDARQAGLPPLPMVRVRVAVSPSAKTGRELRALSGSLIETLQGLA